jgi:hypothetical protein
LLGGISTITITIRKITQAYFLITLFLENRNCFATMPYELFGRKTSSVWNQHFANALSKLIVLSLTTMHPWLFPEIPSLIDFLAETKYPLREIQHSGNQSTEMNKLFGFWKAVASIQRRDDEKIFPLAQRLFSPRPKLFKSEDFCDRISIDDMISHCRMSPFESFSESIVSLSDSGQWCEGRLHGG